MRSGLGGRLRHALAVALDALGVLAWLRRRRACRGQVPVLLFHRVAGTATAPELFAFPVDLFRELVRHAVRHYRLGSWSEALAAVREPPARPVLVITADDGYADQAGTLWPCVRDAGGKLILFVTRDPVARQSRFWWDVASGAHAGSPPALDGAGVLTPPPAAMSEIVAMKAMGVTALARRAEELAGQDDRAPGLPPPMTAADGARIVAEGGSLGGHGVTHATLTACDDVELTAEVTGSREIDAYAGERLETFAYPGGFHDQRVVSAVAAAGYRWAFTTEPGLFDATTDPLRIPRFDVVPAHASPDGRTFSWPLFEAELLGVFDVLLLRSWRRGQTR